MKRAVLIDMSGNNAMAELIDWNAVKASGIDGVYFKATEGVNYQDPHFRAYVFDAIRAGLLIGCYHYLRVRASDIQDADTQAEQFAALVKSVNIPEGQRLPPMVDVEGTNNLRDSKGKLLIVRPTTKQSALAVRMFCISCTHYLSKPVIYTDLGEWEEFGLQTYIEFAIYDLWLANPGLFDPAHVPEPWMEWVMWQYSWTLDVQGIPGHVDSEFFNGTTDDLMAWAATYGKEQSC